MGPKVKGCVNQLELFTFEQKPRGGRLGFILSYERFETGIRALAKKKQTKKKPEVTQPAPFPVITLLISQQPV